MRVGRTPIGIYPDAAPHSTAPTVWLTTRENFTHASGVKMVTQQELSYATPDGRTTWRRRPANILVVLASRATWRRS